MPIFTFCGQRERSAVAPKSPLRVLYLTSVRDTGTCDRNGTIIATPSGPKYMEGAIERTIATTYPGNPLHGIIEVVGIVNDDLASDMRTSDYPAAPMAGNPWIFPSDLCLPTGESAVVITHHIPSDFRALPRHAHAARRERKYQFERRVYELFTTLRADLVISDHYMARIDYLINDFGLFGSVLNIHPAVTIEGHPFCFRGKTPTADAIARAQSGAPTLTGATLHIVDAEIDHGPPIAYAAVTPVYPTDEPQLLRWRNYQTAKLPLLVAGLRHYALHIYPYRSCADLGALTAQR